MNNFETESIDAAVEMVGLLLENGYHAYCTIKHYPGGEPYYLVTYFGTPDDDCEGCPEFEECPCCEPPEFDEESWEEFEDEPDYAEIVKDVIAELAKELKNENKHQR